MNLKYIFLPKPDTGEISVLKPRRGKGGIGWMIKSRKSFLNCLLLFVLIVFLGCSAAGNSQFLAKGKTVHFLTMSACEKEALSEYEGGGRKYSGYECRKMLLGLFQLESKTY